MVENIHIHATVLSPHKLLSTGHRSRVIAKAADLSAFMDMLKYSFVDQTTSNTKALTRIRDNTEELCTFQYKDYKASLLRCRLPRHLLFRVNPPREQREYETRSFHRLGFNSSAHCLIDTPTNTPQLILMQNRFSRRKLIRSQHCLSSVESSAHSFNKSYGNTARAQNYLFVCEYIITSEGPDGLLE